MDFGTNYKIFLSKFYTFRWPLALLVVFLWLCHTRIPSHSLHKYCVSYFCVLVQGLFGKLKAVLLVELGAHPQTASISSLFQVFFCHSQICVLFFFSPIQYFSSIFRSVLLKCKKMSRLGILYKLYLFNNTVIPNLLMNFIQRLCDPYL